MWSLFQAADFARKGLMPIAGGTLEQTESFMEGLRVAWNCEAIHRAKAGYRD